MLSRRKSLERRWPPPALVGSRHLLRKILLSGCVVLLLAGMVWAGGDPWKSKPYQQWDAKDVRKVLDGSPWARSIQVEAPWLNGDAAAGGTDGGSTSGPGPARSGQSPRTGPGGGGAADAASGGPQTAALAMFLVRWSSSRTIREAVIRNLVLAGQMNDDAAAQELAKPVDSYEIVVAGPDMKPIQSVAFFFPKKSDSGISTVAADEKVVDFLCVVTNVKIDASFDTSKMMDSLGRDL